MQSLITSLAAQQNTFVKEECFVANHYLYNEDIIKLPNTYTVFLLRDPHQIILSFYNKNKKGFSKVYAEFESMWKLFEYIKSVNLRQPHIIYAEDLVKDPHKIVKQFCDYADIPFKEESLQWEDLSQNFKNDKIWYDTPYARFSKLWHGNALSTPGFIDMNRTYAFDGNGKPTFEEIEDEKARELCLKFYEEMIPYYKLFLAEYSIQQKSYFEKYVESDKEKVLDKH